jgi:hypothetical protein
MSERRHSRCRCDGCGYAHSDSACVLGNPAVRSRAVNSNGSCSHTDNSYTLCIQRTYVLFLQATVTSSASHHQTGSVLARAALHVS